MAEKKQNPVVVAVLIIIIIGAVFFNVKKMKGASRRTRQPEPRQTQNDTITPLDAHDLLTKKGEVKVQSRVSEEKKIFKKKIPALTIKVELKRLTFGTAYDTQPVFSPDGREIAFVSSDKKGQNIYILNLQNPEEPVKLTKENYIDSHPSWSPDGSKIIFSSNRQGEGEELFWVDKFTGDITPLDKAGIMPMLSPDEERLAFVDQHNIWIMMLSTKEFYPLTKSGYNSWPFWDKYGKKIYFSNSGFIKVVDYKSPEEMILTSSGFSDYPAVSSDNRLVYVSLESERYDLWMMNTDGTDKVQLTSDTAREYFPSWSPDSKSIVFASDASGLSNLWLLTLPEK